MPTANASPEIDVAVLCERDRLLRKLREFFHQRNFFEVETPLLADELIPELHIDPIRTESGFLQSSPELHMKRLVATGMQAIFQVTRSFRAGERGPLHKPEFTIVEWYRVGDDLMAGMRLLDELSQATLSAPTAKRTTYAEAFAQHVGIDPQRASVEQLRDRAVKLNLSIPKDMQDASRDEWLNLLLALRVEPQLGLESPEILHDFPVTQAALARAIARDGVEVAERFELYWQGMELANGYHELTDADELRRRLQQVNQQRKATGRKALPMPESLLSAMDVGLPPCAGCALGFDRLVMLALGKKSIDQVCAFGTEGLS